MGIIAVLFRGIRREFEEYRTGSSSRLAQRRERNLRIFVFSLDMLFCACGNARGVDEVGDMR